VGTQSADLTRREFELLHLLAEGRGQVLQREEIYQRVWGYEMARGDRSVDVFVRKVRSKLKALSPEWSYIHTHFGIGYRFQPEPSDGEPVEDAPAAADGDLGAPREGETAADDGHSAAGRVGARLEATA
jgi:DNA-binding winged helix-turn-helix (wHTH) protein